MAEWGEGSILRDAVASGPVRTRGRARQLVGLVLLPLGVLFGMEGGPHAMSLEIAFGLAGVAVFVLGLTLQRRAG